MSRLSDRQCSTKSSVRFNTRLSVADISSSDSTMTTALPEKNRILKSEQSDKPRLPRLEEDMLSEDSSAATAIERTESWLRSQSGEIVVPVT